MSHNIGTLDMQNNKIIRLAAGGTNLSDAVNYGQISSATALSSLSNGTVSAGANSVALGQVVFSNSNNVSFGLNGSTITASASVAAGGGITNIRVSAGTASNYLSALTFADSNGVSFGLNGSTITGSHNGLTSQSNQALSAGNGSFTFQTATFADSNGVSFSTGTQGIYATVKTDYLTSQSNQAASASNGSFAFQTLGFSNANAVTFGTSAGSIITASIASSLTNIKVSAGTASNNLSAVTFSDSNGVSFGLNGSVITGSVATSLTNIKISAGTASNNLSAVTFSDSNGVSFGLNGSVITATVKTDYLTSQSNQAASASNGSFTFQTLGFSNANNVTFGTSAGSIISASVAAQTVESQSLGISNLGNTSGTSGIASGGQVRYLFAGGNNITLSQSVNGASGTVTISAFNQTVESQSLGMSNLGNSSGTSGIASGGQVQFLFAGGNNITLSQSLNGASGTITISGPNPSAAAVTFGMSNLGNTSGTSGTVNAQMLIAGGNNITVSQSVNGQSVTVTVSAFNQTVESQSFGASNLGNTAGTSGIASGGQVRAIVCATDGLGISQSVNGASVTQTIYRPTIGRMLVQPPWGNNGTLHLSAYASTIFLNVLTAPFPITVSKIDMPVRFQAAVSSNANNTTYGGTISHGWALYYYDSVNDSLTRGTSASTTYTFSYTSDAGQYTNVTGIRLMSMAFNATLTEGQYWLAYSHSSLARRTNSTGGTVTTAIAYGHFVGYENSYAASNFGSFNAAANATVKPIYGQGFYSQSNAFPASIGDAQVSLTAALGFNINAILRGA